MGIAMTNTRRRAAALVGAGFPHLHPCHSVDWSCDNNRRCGVYAVGVDRDVCPPKEFQGIPHVLYRNNGNGTFTDVSKEAGLNQRGMLDANGKQVEVGKLLDQGSVDMAEAQLRNAMSIGEGSAMVFLQRPVSLILIVVVVAVLVLPRLARRWAAGRLAA